MAQWLRINDNSGTRGFVNIANVTKLVVVPIVADPGTYTIAAYPADGSSSESVVIDGAPFASQTAAEDALAALLGEFSVPN